NSGFQLCVLCDGRRRCLQPVLVLQEFRGALADYYAGRHRIAGRYARQNRSVCNTEALHAVDLQSAVDNRHFYPAHFRRPGLMPEGAESVPKKAFQIRRIEWARCNLAASKRTERPRVANLARSAETCDQVLQVLRITKIVCLDCHRGGGVA